MNTGEALFSVSYKNYAASLYGEIRKETFGEDIGQTSWLTADEYREYMELLELSRGKKVLEVASGTGGPAIFMVQETGCQLTGIDINENGIRNARQLAAENGLSEKTEFLRADAAGPLPFPDESFDALVSIDSINHLNNRPRVLREFHRVLKKGGRILFTDAVVVTGILTNEEIATRSSLGFFLFVPTGENERLLKNAGFQLTEARDVTANAADIAGRWYSAREKRKTELQQYEGIPDFEGLQDFFRMVHLLSSEKRLSRFMYTAVK